jgi:hypothetical protein
MEKKKVLSLMLTLLLTSMLAFNIQSVKADPVINQPTAIGTITIEGNATLEGASDHSGISIEVWLNGSSVNKAAETTAGSDGFYRMVGVPSLSSGDWYAVVAVKDGYAYAGDSRMIHSSEATPGAEVVVDDMVLHTQKWVSFNWRYQPDGTTNLSTGDLSSGSVILYSESEPCGFIFSTNSVTGFVADVYFGDNRRYPYSFWANNGAGGVHDMGAVPLDSVTEAPDVSNGVGVYEFYDNQATHVMVGHTYCIVTKDGNHYAKICVIGVGSRLTDLNHDGTINKTDLSIIARAFRSRKGDANWNPTADLNIDEVINILDVAIVAKEFGKTA